MLPHKPTPQALTVAPPFDTSLLAGQLSPRSAAMYARDFAAYLVFAASPDAAMQPETLARWRTWLASASDAHPAYSPHTINRMVASVRAVMQAAAEQGYLAGDTADAFRRVRGVSIKALKEQLKPHRRTRIVPEDMRRLCEAPDVATLIGLRDRALLHTLASSGVRAEELRLLTQPSILEDARGLALRIQGKNDIEPREAPLSAEARAAIQTWLELRPVPSAYIFTSFTGGSKDGSHLQDGGKGRLTAKPMSAPTVWRVVQHYALQCGLEHIKPHDFRRFVGTQLAKVDIRKAQKALGHKRIDTTAQHYVLDELERGMTDQLY